MYQITRRGQRIAGSLAVPYEAAVLAAQTLNQEYRRRDEFGWEPDPTATPYEQNQSERMSRLVSLALAPTC